MPVDKNFLLRYGAICLCGLVAALRDHKNFCAVMVFFKKSALWVAIMLVTQHGICAEPAVTLHYFPRPPYIQFEGESLTGLTGSVAVTAFKAAEIPYAISNTPASRFLLLLKANKGMDCGIGWFKNTEREEFGKFTKPIYQDEPMVALTWNGNAKLKASTSVEAALANRDLTLLVKQSFSYGKALDQLMDRLQPNRQVVTVETVQMLKMIQARRADYMFISPEEWSGSIIAAALPASDFEMVRLANMPKGESRYIFCSKGVPDSVLSRLNAAIK